MNASGICVIGTPDMAIAQIQRLIDQSGGFGTYLLMAHEWADRQATLASYEASSPSEVMPTQPGARPATRHGVCGLGSDQPTGVHG